MTITSKLVMRVLDANGRLLGWCQHEADVKGDGMLRARGLVPLTLDVPGVPHVLSVHWADINAEIRLPMPVVNLIPAGIAIALFQHGQPIIVAGQPPKERLVPVSTKSSVEVGIPAGSLGALPGGAMVVSGA